MKKIKIGILGCANIAVRSVIPVIKELQEHFTLVGISSRTKAKADQWAKEMDTQAFYSYDAILDNTIIDAVYIPLPNSLHFEWAKKALEKGIHVLMEKSLACSFDEVQELVNIAEKKQLALVENFQFRFHHQLQKIQQIIEDKTIGELRCVRSAFGFPPFSDVDNIRYKKELGGGALLDAGAYPIKISSLLLGKNIEVKAAKKNTLADSEVDIWGGGMIVQRNGQLFSEIAFGFDNYYQCNLELWGSKGKLTASRIFTAPPGFVPEVVVETQGNKEVIEVEACNHFENILKYFHTVCFSEEKQKQEYEANILQARLINEFKIQSDE